jgi:hypothetical protein
MMTLSKRLIITPYAWSAAVISPLLWMAYWMSCARIKNIGMEKYGRFYLPSWTFREKPL